MCYFGTVQDKLLFKNEQIHIYRKQIKINFGILYLLQIRVRQIWIFLYYSWFGAPHQWIKIRFKHGKLASSSRTNYNYLRTVWTSERGLQRISGAFTSRRSQFGSSGGFESLTPKTVKRPTFLLVGAKTWHGQSDMIGSPVCRGSTKW